MDAKKLKQLAKSCRSAGISHYRDSEVEFTLTAERPSKVVNKKQKQTDHGPETEFESDTPSGEALLFWSSQGLDSEPTSESN